VIGSTARTGAMDASSSSTNRATSLERIVVPPVPDVAQSNLTVQPVEVTS
jgi:hypothetical protein